jgi:DNA-binding SARP family transcriptional activator
VRRVLGGGVVADRSTVRLDLDEVETDLEAFWEASIDAAIVAAYAGEFLPGDVYEDWTGPFRDEARTRFVTAARRVAASHADAGHHRLAVEVGRRLVSLDPYDADAHELVIQSLEALGESREADRARKTWDAAIAELDDA